MDKKLIQMAQFSTSTGLNLLLIIASVKSPDKCFDVKEKQTHQLHNSSTQKHKNLRRFQIIARLFHSLQHLFGSVTAQVIGHRINTVQGRFHIQAANEILGVVLVQIERQFGHICPVLWPVLAELISGGAVLWGDRKRNISQVKRVQRHFAGVIAAGKLGQRTAPSSTSRQLDYRLMHDGKGKGERQMTMTQGQCEVTQVNI